jgi:hypothetical protein
MRVSQTDGQTRKVFSDMFKTCFRTYLIFIQYLEAV